ncbi:MAG: hypothetical protein HFI82_00270 [Eubacterium sp.]|jgi:hypothetical protein|nr:hypothetical protein [Eubacterium sp.]
MKKVLAMLLTGCIAVQTWLGTSMPAYGADIGTKAGTLAQETRSILDVEVRSSRLFPYQGKVSVKLSGDGKIMEQKTLEFTEEASASRTARFQVPAGDYKVEVAADKFAGYTQDVHVEEGWITKIVVSSVKNENEGSAAPGWICIGDVNQDAVVDQKDTGLILNAIRNHQQSMKEDLNGDGKVDMADLQYAVQSIGESQSQKSQVEKLGLVLSTNPADGTVIADGALSDFLNNAGTIALKTQNEEAISEENPVALDFVLSEGDAASVPIEGIAIHAPTAADEDGYIASEITGGEASVIYTDENGAEQELSIPFAGQSAAIPEKASASADGDRMEESLALVRRAVGRAAARVNVEANGALVLDFGTQIAVKRVTIKITGTKKTEPLVNIAKVEFVNNMEERIPAPQLDVPTLNTLESVNSGLVASWSAQKNVTGYEVYIQGPVKKSEGIETQIIRVSGNCHRMTSINDKPMKNFEKYTVKVRSVNGDWSSPWSNVQIGEPKPEKLPAPPDNVTAAGGFRSLSVSWKDMDDANGYMVYYKKTQDKEFQPVVEGFTQTVAGTGKIDENRYTISGLEEDTEYTVYVIGWNELGWGKPSLTSLAKTKNVSPPKLPDYMLLNTSKGEGVVSEHITGAAYGGSGGAHMEGSPLDTTAGTAWGLVDNDYGSYWVKNDWDDGCAYPTNDKGMTITLDDDYRMNYITYAAVDQVARLEYARVGYWSKDGSEEKIMGTKVLEKRDENDNPFYIIKFNETITANKVHLSFGRASVRADMKVGEIHFHRYDSLEDEIMGLYADEMHTTLKNDVTEAVIAALETRLETRDEASKELHPLYSELKLELKTAREILNSDLAPSYEVDNTITAKKDGHLGFGGLNAWQPLGKAVNAGDSILVYVGHNVKRTGDSAGLQLVFTQHHSEAGGFFKTVGLKVGRNEITVPRISTKDFERGGQVYVAYTGNNASDQYAVRISGGSDIPSLSVYGKAEAERRAAIEAYVEELGAYVGKIEENHGTQHVNTENAKYDYDQTNCILNATDIMMEDMMYSLPATQIWAGIQSAQDKVTKLDNALKAMEDTMTLFYQHKGLSDDAGTAHGKNAMPSQHLNIRYMRMFAGAFMYASGNHIGIEWGSSALSGPNDMSGFGWGIAHEIGHDINQGSYAVAEVTNNYFAQLLTGKIRYTYDNVYKKVTSGSVGRASNVFTQLALYWQLHLAFDDQADDRHIYDNYEEQFNNLFFARVDTYSRNPAMAPQEGLALNGGSDQNLMRLACAAANKNILPFFERWGMVPDEATVSYAEKYGEADEKAIYYANEDARSYRLANPQEAGTVKDEDAITEAVVTAHANQAEIRIAANRDADLILGYEISRSMISNGEKKTEVVGFKPIDTAASTVFVDTVSTINNRVMEYEVRAVDKYLNYSNVKSAGSVKIQTDGVLEKSSWTVETNMTSEDDVAIDPDEEDPDSGYHESGSDSLEEKKINSIERILDNDRTAAGTYNGSSDGTAVITVDMHKTEEVTSLKYQGSALSDVTVEVSEDGTAWTAVKEHYAGLDGTNDTIWFDSVEEGEREHWIGTYNARYVRLTISQAGNISIQEIEVCGPSGDNLEFMKAGDGQPAVGVLTADYQYGDKAEDVIPQGSLIFTGTYKGNPAYNIVILYDGDGNVVGEKDGNVLAKQVILAEKPKQGNLGETSDGTWVYYVEPGQWDEASLQKMNGVRGELYRVDNALTLEGERIVSDTQLIQLPDVLPNITFQGGSK